MQNNDVLAFSYDDEYDENFTEKDFELAESEVESGKDALDSIDDELLDEMFSDEMQEDSLEAEAKAALLDDWKDEKEKFEEDEVFEEFVE